MTPPPDAIEIRRLRVATHIGVPDQERAGSQTLLVTVHMVPAQGFTGLHDRIDHTIDYHAVAMEIQSIGAEKPRNLIETLALDIAEALLSRHPLQRVAVTIEKHILPDTECVAVHVVREIRTSK